MAKYQVSDGCCFCMECQFVCPVGAISMDSKGAHIHEEKCIGCGKCAQNCASEAIERKEI
ncbi:MAG: 4Fe-4S dicluster domain-containing protein [Ruminococcaceae bacterium]|nr:4Fe-4S dicluster domain-containing protein [Oscillospiraceae bacterium]